MQYIISIDGVGTGLTSRGSRSTTRTQLTNEIGNNTILIVNHAVYVTVYAKTRHK